MKTCVVYARVSTIKQAKNSSLKCQIDQCMEYAKDHGLWVGAIFSEVGNVESRYPIRAQAVRVARANDGILLCVSSDRWSRAGVGDLPPDDIQVLYASPLEAKFSELIQAALSSYGVTCSTSAR